MQSKLNIKWKKEAAWWDNLEVPDEENGPHTFTWLDSIAPAPEEHDFVLYTDGSGCTKGWGASASIIEQIEFSADEDVRRVAEGRRVLVSATYGSSVQRRELTAFLDGIHEILRVRTEDFLDQELEDWSEIDRKNVLNNFTGPNRVSVLWFTDRMNLAKSLLFDERGDLLNARSSEVDLWLRFSAMARYVCVTPMCLPRNENPKQEMCDSLCGIARRRLMSCRESMEDITRSIYGAEKWNQIQPQKALF
jgi:hypothetical protein